MTCTGVLLGTAVGDALLLPGEGLTRAAIARRFPGALRHRLIAGYGLVSDDTEHAFFTAQALLAHAGDVHRFQRSLAWKMRWWFAALPGGIGLATARSCLRLWCGIPPHRSGVWSAGNGAAMRAAIIGARFPHDAQRRQSFVTASTAITHRDPQANIAATALAEAVAWIRRGESLDELWHRLDMGDDPWRSLMGRMRQALVEALSVDAWCTTLGLDRAVGGYAYHSVPVALYAWLRHRDDPRAGLAAVFRAGGDVDTTGAFAGALFGAAGVDRFPQEWLDGVGDRPLSLAVLRRAGQALDQERALPVKWWWPLQPLRNLVFIMIIIGHGFRRLYPW